MARYIILSLSLALFCTPAGAESDLGRNAALRYWQAFSNLPDLTDDDYEVIDDWSTIDLKDARARRIIDRSRTAMDQLVHAAEIDPCDWGLDSSQGFAMLMPHLTKSRDLGRLACLTARDRFASGDTKQAIELLGATGKLARDTGQPSLLISQLVQVAIQSMIQDCLAANVHRLTDEQRAALLKELSATIPAPRLSDGLRAERDIALPWLRQLANNPAKMMQAIQGSGGGDAGPNLPDGNEGVQMMRKQLDLLEQDYNELIAVADGSIEDIEKTTDRIIDRAKRESRMFTQLLMPALGGASRALKISNVKTHMLRAGMVHLSDGEAAASKIEDPEGDGPFRIKRADDAITLSSALEDRKGKPVTVTITTK